MMKTQVTDKQREMAYDAAQRIKSKLINDILHILAHGTLNAVSACQYETRDGEKIEGVRIQEVMKGLRDLGWKNPSSIVDEDVIRVIGFRVVEARYVGGVQAQRWAREVVTL